MKWTWKMDKRKQAGLETLSNWVSKCGLSEQSQWEHAGHQRFSVTVKVQLSLTMQTDQNKEVLGFFREAARWQPRSSFLKHSPCPPTSTLYFNPPDYLAASQIWREKEGTRRVKRNEENCGVNDLAWVIVSQEVGWKYIQIRLAEKHKTQ